MPRFLIETDVRFLLREARKDLATVQGWPADALCKCEWEYAVGKRIESLIAHLRRLSKTDDEELEEAGELITV